MKKMEFVWLSKDNLQFAVAVFGGFVGILAFVAQISAIVYTIFKLNKKPPRLQIEDGKEYPGVSIIKPCKGVDSHLETNLETYFHLDYPKFEIVFCVHTAQDKAISVMERLINKYPQVDAKIVIGRGNIGPNPKINNMVYGYEVMKYDIFWICDARINALPDTLREMMLHMEGNVALVHALPFVLQRSGFAGTLEKVYFGSHHALQYICANMVGITCMTGMSNLIRKDVVEDHIGGLKNLAMYIAEDYYMAKYIRSNGWRCTIASMPARQNLGNPTISNFLDRMIRWKKLHVAMVPFVVVSEPLLEFEVNGALVAYALYYLYGCNPLAVFLYRITIWFILDYILLRCIENQRIVINKCEILVAWVYRAIITPYIIFSALRSPIVNWMGRKYRLRRGGIGEEIFD